MSDQASDHVNSQWQAGDVLLEQYKVVAILGQDQMGEIYKAAHLDWKTPLIIRSLKPELVHALGGFESLQPDIAAWSNLDLNPHLVHCYYLRQLDDRFLVFTEYNSGNSLRHWISSRELYASGAALRQMLDIAIQLAWGLQAAQEQGITQPHLNPDTVHLTPNRVAKLGDLGLRNLYRLVGGSQNASQSSIQAWGSTVLEMFWGDRIDRNISPNQTPNQILATYLRTGGAADAKIPALPEALVNLLKACFAEPTTLDLRQIVHQLKTIYQTTTASTYPRQTPTPAPLADRLNNQALCYWDLNHPEAAFALWEQALAAQPNHTASLYNQGLLNWRLGKIDDWTLLQQLADCKTAGVPIADYLIGSVQLERGDYQAALMSLTTLEDVPEEIATDLEACRNLARNQPPVRQWLRRLQTRSTDVTQAIALSADGRYALSGGDDRQLKLWQVNTGQCLYTLRGHEGEVTALAFSPDGFYVVSGSADRTLKLWNVTSTSLVHTFDGLRTRHQNYQSSVDKLFERVSVKAKQLLHNPKSDRSGGHQDTILTVDFSHDRHYLLSGSADKTIKLWEVETGRCLQTYRGHQGAVLSVQFSTDRQQALSASADQTVRLWDLATGQILQTLTGFQDLAAAIFLPDRQQILTVSAVLQLWDGQRGEVVKTLTAQGASFASVALLQANLVLSGGTDRLIRLWDLTTGRCLRTFEGHELEVQALCASQENHYALSADTSCLNLWMIKGKEATPTAALQWVHTHSVERLSEQDRYTQQALMQAQTALQQGRFDTAAQLLRQLRSQSGPVPPEVDRAWQDLYLYLPRQALNQVAEQTVLQRHTSGVYAVALRSDGRALTGSADQTVKLWDVTTGRCLLSFEGHRGPVASVLFHPDGVHAASGSADRCLKIWNLQSGECVWTLEGHTGAVKAIAFSPEGRLLLSGSEDGICRLWDVAAHSCLRTFEAQVKPITAVSFSPDGQRVLMGSTDGTLKLWNLAGQCLRTWTGHTAEIGAVAWSADGRHFLSGSADKTLKLWNCEGDCLRTLARHEAAVRSVAISGDGNYALSGSEDRSLKLWNLNHGECLRSLTGHSGAVRAVDWSPEGRYVLSGSEDGSSRCWSLDWELTEYAPTAWDEAARPYLETFLTLQTVTTPSNSEDPHAVLAALKPRPTWTETDFQRLIQTLQQAGLGWLQTEGVRQQLMRMAQAAIAEPVLKQPDVTVFPTAFAQEFTTVFGESATAKVTLFVKSGSLSGQEFVFREPTTCIIGRAKDCQLQLPNDEQHNMVSRYHCSLEINPPSIRIRDLGSLHGTYVNGQIIGRRSLNSSQAPAGNLPDYALTTGDEIQVGQTVLHVIIEGADQQQPQQNFDETGLADQTFFPAKNRDGKSNSST